MTNELTGEDKNNPFLALGQFDLHDLQLLTEAIGLFTTNNSRLMFRADEIHEIAKITDDRKRAQAISRLTPKFEGHPLDDHEISRLELIDNLVLDAMGALEAKEGANAVIISLEEHLKKETKREQG